MNRIRQSLTLETVGNAVMAVVAVAATTALLVLIGRAALGEAVIALLYLVPVGWSASRWGQGVGICAAVAAALAFDYFFIPPFGTLNVGSLEGWLVLAIFLAVAIVVVGRIQSGLSQAQASERTALFMYELSAALAGLRTQAAVAHTVAQHLQQMSQAPRVRVVIQGDEGSPGVVVDEPPDGGGQGRPDRIVPIWNAWGLVGEIRLWRGQVELPLPESRLLQNLALQAGQALERTRFAEAEARGKDPATAPNMDPKQAS